MSITKLDTRQSVNRSALGMVGSAAGDTLDSILAKIDPELSKLFEDRNILLVDGGLITYTGTAVQFGENLKLHINSQVAGGSPTVIDLAATTRTVSASGKMIYAVINRTAGTAVVTDDASTLPAQTSANQEVVLLAKRVDAGDGTKRLYWRNGMAMNEGQTVRLGASGSGSGSGSGTGDDLDSLLYRASFNETFPESGSFSASSVDITSAKTNATYSAAKAMWTMNYDAAKTIAAGTTTTNINISATASFTVATGDLVIIGGVARKITAVATQASFTTEAFDTAASTGTQVTVSQAVHTKDIYNLPVDGVSIASGFGSATFSEVTVDYKDNATASSNLWTPNVAPFVAFSASHNGTSFTTQQVRATNETDTSGSTTLNAAGTGLYIRFYSAATSGTGFVNLITYKAFMQKALASASGGVINYAYGFTNGVGTPVNCSFSVVSGKTQVALTSPFQYSVGLNSGGPYGSIDVYLNGQLIPRFINSTLTPDASYTEVSSSIIQLDTDYSAVNVNIEILQSFQVVDASTTNVTNISYLKEIQQNGFQNFVTESASLTAFNGTPSTGQFRTFGIVNRASIPDLSQNLKVSLGIDRLQVQQPILIPNEFGPNGEEVWGAVNDSRNLMRFVGNWVPRQGTDGVSIASTTIGDYIEIVFFGTGLNILNNNNSGGRDIRVTTDGGSEGANIYTVSSSVIGARNYATNQVLNVVSGLSLGLHTVRMKIYNTQVIVYGFEILNESSTLKVNTGSAYVNGSKISLASQQSPAYASSFTNVYGTAGARGSRVLVYMASDGTIKKDVQYVDTSQLNLASADHTNEEVIRTYLWREFGAGRSDDFSLVKGADSTVNKAFTLDDNTTTLVGQQVLAYNNGTAPEGVFLNTNAGYLDFTFVGTGLDIIRADDGSGNNGATDTQVFVDGTSIGFYPITNSLSPRRFSLVSGLPYGTHNVKILRNAAASNATGVVSFIVYGPKKPTLPTGAIELADYNIMATYVANSTTNVDAIGTGTLRKLSLREFIYVGSWSANLATADIGGQNINSVTNGDYVQYTFWGTGFEYRFTSNATSSTWQFTVDGSTNLTTLGGSPVTTSYGPSVSSFTASTGTLVTNTTSSTGTNGVTLSGLTLGLHTVRFTKTGGTGTLSTQAYDLITPIHTIKPNLVAEMQSTLTIGSCALSDNRKTSAIKASDFQQARWARAVGVAGSPSTTSNAYVPMPDMYFTFQSNGKPIKLDFYSEVANSSLSDTYVRFHIDGIPVGNENSVVSNPANQAINISLSDIFQLTPGAHQIAVYWKQASGGTVFAISTSRALTVSEIN